MNKVCEKCSAGFEVTKQDTDLLAKMTPVFNDTPYPIPEPTLCFQCRLQRRLAFYNSRNLYKRTCDKTGETIVSTYAPNTPFTVYSRKVWYGDSWDPKDYGKEIDFTRPFFEQFRELMEQVPMQSLILMGNQQNSDFTNDNLNSKNSYLIFDGEVAEDCLYGHTYVRIKSCMDFVALVDCEVCFECLHCSNCYNCRYCFYSQNCWDSWFLKDCIGCKYCYGCTNLRQKEYCIFNEQKTKKEFEAFMQSRNFTSWSALQSAKKEAEAFMESQPVKAVRGEQNIHALGDNLFQSKNSYYCFDCIGMQDCNYCTDCLMGAKDCLDVHIWGSGMELVYDSALIGVNIRNVISSYYIDHGCEKVYYSIFCSRNCKILFGCIGMRQQQHCILNKQYSPEEYESLCSRLVEHMQKTGEWGQFFPPSISMFGYNETMANTFYPYTKQEALDHGFQWSDYEAPVTATKTIDANQLPDSQTDVPDDVLNWAIICSETKKPFKIVKQELEFYRQHNLPLPRLHPDARHAHRFTYKNPYKLWERTCAKCQSPIQTSYNPERPEIVYCESCYLSEVY